MKNQSDNSSLKFATSKPSGGKVISNMPDIINANISANSLQQGFCHDAMENAPFSIGLLDTVGKILQQNKTMALWLGNSAGEMLENFLHEEDAPLFKRALKRTVELSHSYSDMEVRLQGDNLQERWVSISMKALADGQIAVYMNDISRRKKTENELLNLANTDHLTGLFNRLVFDTSLKNAVKNSRRYNRQGAVLYIDLNDFKKVNDAYGHKTGDKLLIEIAKTLKNLFRETDIVARIGGDEFAVLMEEVSAPQANFKGHAVERAIRKLQVEAEGEKVACSASVGVKVFNGDDIKTIEDIVIAADKAMYDRKNASKSLNG